MSSTSHCRAFPIRCRAYFRHCRALSPAADASGSLTSRSRCFTRLGAQQFSLRPRRCSVKHRCAAVVSVLFSPLFTVSRSYTSFSSFPSSSLLTPWVVSRSFSAHHESTPEPWQPIFTPIWPIRIGRHRRSREYGKSEIAPYGITGACEPDEHFKGHKKLT